MDTHTGKKQSNRPIYLILGTLGAVALLWYALSPSTPSLPIIEKVSTVRVRPVVVDSD